MISKPGMNGNIAVGKAGGKTSGSVTIMKSMSKKAPADQVFLSHKPYAGPLPPTMLDLMAASGIGRASGLRPWSGTANHLEHAILSG